MGNYLQTRFLDFARSSCWLLLLIFLVGCAYYIIWYVYLLLLKPVLEPFVFATLQCLKEKCACCKCANKKEGVESDKRYADAVQDMKKQGITYDYRMGHNERYAAAAKAIQKTGAEEHENAESGHGGGGIFGWFGGGNKDENKEEEKKEEEKKEEEKKEEAKQAESKEEEAKQAESKEEE